jgi:hypothetical protein
LLKGAVAALVVVDGIVRPAWALPGSDWESVNRTGSSRSISPKRRRKVDVIRVWNTVEG